MKKYRKILTSNFFIAEISSCFKYVCKYVHRYIRIKQSNLHLYVHEYPQNVLKIPNVKTPRGKKII